jgi:hypothetical protein
MTRTIAALLGTAILAGCGGTTTLHLGETGNEAGAGGQSGTGAGGSTGTGGQGVGGAIIESGGTEIVVLPDGGMGACKPNAGPSEPLSLTNLEYDNTVRDLLGDTSAPSVEFPKDPIENGFRKETSPPDTHRLSHYAKTASDVAGRAVSQLSTLLPCDPQVVGETACASQFISSFGRRAYRRPLTTTEISDMQQAFGQGRMGGDFTSGIRTVITTMLANPGFYEIEHQAPLTGLAPLNPYQLASRLSYFIYRSMPDDALLAAAEGGKLATKVDAEREARRMLADPKARNGILDFFSEWLSLDQVGGLQKDATLYPNFLAQRTDLPTETMKFVESVFFGDGQFRSLLQSSTTWINEPLAQLYAQSGVVGLNFQQVMLNPKIRAGILTQGSFLSLTGNKTTGSPTQRGTFVRERLLCQAMPPPPANSNLPLMEPMPGQTNRQRYMAAIGAGGPACAGCHNLIDPIGYGFEEFDAVGGYRSMDNGLPVDASGNLTSVGTIDGPFLGAVDLASKLGSSPEVRSCVVKQWFRFALSRTESDDDACAVDAAKQVLDKSGSLPELVVAIATSDSFRYARW